MMRLKENRKRKGMADSSGALLRYLEQQLSIYNRETESRKLKSTYSPVSTAANKAGGKNPDDGCMPQ